MWTEDKKVKEFLKPQIKTLLETILGRKVRLAYCDDRGGSWNQINVTPEEKQMICEIWSKQDNNVKSSWKQSWGGKVGSLYFKDEDGEYIVSLVNAVYNRDKRFSFEYIELSEKNKQYYIEEKVASN